MDAYDCHSEDALSEARSMLGSSETVSVREDGSRYIELFDGPSTMHRARRVRDAAALLLEEEPELDIQWYDETERETAYMVQGYLHTTFTPGPLDYIKAALSRPRDLINGDAELSDYELTYEDLPDRNGYRLALEER